MGASRPGSSCLGLCTVALGLYSPFLGGGLFRALWDVYSLLGPCCS